MVSYLLKEGPLCLVIEADQLLHHHHLACLSVGNLRSMKQEVMSSL